MSTETNQKRVLSLDVHPSRFGYVIFEGPEELLDWGVRSFRDGVNAVRIPPAQKVGTLLDDFAPSAIVLEKRESLAKKAARHIQTVQREAAKRRVPVRWVTRRMVKRIFDGHERNKDEIAFVLGQRFPELAPKVPPRRKIWQSEDYRMSIFDAAALGVAYFDRLARRVSPVPPGNLLPS
ncbi:MAG: hypothetical protein LAP13_26025 [Acidobacteriia bacterium]|nr:hypothetical protein [Terriglobia bacterium]